MLFILPFDGFFAVDIALIETDNIKDAMTRFTNVPIHQKRELFVCAG
jgi:hypothetical protein